MLSLSRLRNTWLKDNSPPERFLLFFLCSRLRMLGGGKIVVGDFFLCLLFGWLSFILSFAIANHSQLDKEKKEFFVL